MQFRRPSQPQASINIAPLVDVVFLLVIFFAVSTTFLDTAGLKLELPSSSSSAQRESRELVVQLAADGRITFDGESVERQALDGRLREALRGREGEARQVVLQADREARHGDVVAVMDRIQAAGAEGFRIDAQPAGQ
jgi:biopolymer transport protein ExbD